MKRDSSFMSNPDNASLYIVAGDSGINAKKHKELIERYNRILTYNNTYLVFIRGNNDNPAMFDGELINLSNIKAIPDYSVIHAADKNILCVGGAISVDRIWKIGQEKIINKFSSDKKLYWEGEKPVFDEAAIKEITSTCKIDYVVSHSAPSFINVSDNISDWVKKDDKLSDDIWKERVVMDKVFETLRDNDSVPTYWAFNHFSNNLLEKRSNVIFRSLPNGVTNINIDINSIICEESEKKKTLSSKIKSMSFGDTFNIGNQRRDDGFVEIRMANEPDNHEEDYGDLADEGEEIEEAVPNDPHNDNPFDNELAQAPEEGHGARLGGVFFDPLRYVNFARNDADDYWRQNADATARNLDALREALHAYNNDDVAATTVTTTAMADGTVTTQVDNGNG